MGFDGFYLNVDMLIGDMSEIQIDWGLFDWGHVLYRWIGDLSCTDGLGTV
jgi:hypothetical protein